MLCGMVIAIEFVQYHYNSTIVTLCYYITAIYKILQSSSLKFLYLLYAHNIIHFMRILFAYFRYKNYLYTIKFKW